MASLLSKKGNEADINDSDTESIPIEASEDEIEIDETDDEEEDDDNVVSKIKNDEEEEDEEEDIDEEDGGDEDDGEEKDGDEEDGDEADGEKITKKRTQKQNVIVNTIGSIDMLKANKKTHAINYDDDGDDDDDDDEDADEHDDVNYLQKFDSKMRDNFILDHHPESRTHNYEEVKALTRISRNGQGIIIDPLHKTIPFLTKYEMTRVIGQRAKQLDSGAKSFVKVPINVVDGYQIALIELEQKKLPFIIKRPFPNGGVEYWNVSDLEVLL
jgi:DNA-directed RNA polymerase subunit K/omega